MISPRAVAIALVLSLFPIQTGAAQSSGSGTLEIPAGADWWLVDGRLSICAVDGTFQREFPYTDPKAFRVALPPGDYTIALLPWHDWAPMRRATIRAGTTTRIRQWSPRKNTPPLHWHVHKPDGSPWANRRLDDYYVTDANGDMHSDGNDRAYGSGWDEDIVVGPEVAPVRIPSDRDAELHIDVMIGRDVVVTRVGDAEEQVLGVSRRVFMDSMLEGFPTGLDHEGFSVLPAIYVRSQVTVRKEPADTTERTQWQLIGGFQLPLFGQVSGGGHGSDVVVSPDPFLNHHDIVPYWYRRALDGARLCLVGRVGLALAATAATNAFRPLTALLGLKFRLGDDTVAQHGASGLDLSVTLPFDAVRDLQGERVDAILDASVAAGAGIEVFGFRFWLSVGRGIGEQAFTRIRTRAELAVMFVSVGWTIEARIHDQSALNSVVNSLILGFGGLAHGPSVVVEFRLGGTTGNL
ncbi:MAG: hypothetical protein AB7K09_21160, partial [Planctomycetota bacterium]